MSQISKTIAILVLAASLALITYSLVLAKQLQGIQQVKGTAITVDEVTDAINHNRSTPLTINTRLQKVAQAKAEDMIARHYFDHTNPDGDKVWKAIKSESICYLKAGENLAEGYEDVETMDKAWMNSPGHRENIENPDYNEIGVGIAKGRFEGRLTTMVVTLFIKQ